MTSAVGIAIAYIRRGWAPVPVPFRQKGPVIEGWQKLRLTERTARRYFNGGPLNVGVILGPASNNLADVDLDCDEAIAAAALLLPLTIRFGRTTARNSHWLYCAEFADAGKAVIAFDDPIKLTSAEKAKARLVELRTGADDKGCQTVFPGSVHMTGEPATARGRRP
jgi:hypothetical protein